MKKIKIVSILIFLVISCNSKERKLGDGFLIYKGDYNYPESIGFDVGEGGTQGLLDGDFVKYGYDQKFITLMTRNGEYFYIDKLKVIADPAEPSNRGQGPFNQTQFREIEKAKGLPALKNSP